MKRNLLESTLNLLFPPVCGMCNKLSDGYLCNYCYEYLKTQEKNKADVYSDTYFGKHFWIYEYKNEIREKIIDYKFNDKSYLYRTFVELILKNESAVDYIKSFDVIIPVPIHKKRLKKRGYNQSYLIAKAICSEINEIELRSDIITKIKNISPQSSLNRSERLENISGAYAVIKKNIVDANKLQKQKILLLDDVFTTGSTVNECAKILKELTNRPIGIFTLAKD